MHPLNCLPYLRAFDAVVRHGTVREAGDDLGVTPGAVSMQLKKLGEVTGLTLFEKDGRGLRLTPAGHEFAQVVRRNLLGISIGLHQASRQDQIRGLQPLRLSIPFSVGVAWLASAIVAFSRQASMREVYVSQRQTADDIDWSVTDLAVVWGQPPFPGCWWQLLADAEARPVCAPRLATSLDLHSNPRALTDVTILHEDEGATWARWSSKAGISLADAAHVYLPTPAMAQSAAVQGLGIALISNLLARNDLRDGRLLEIFRTSVSRQRSYFFVCPEERANQPLITSAVTSISAFVDGRR